MLQKIMAKLKPYFKSIDERKYTVLLLLLIKFLKLWGLIASSNVNFNLVSWWPRFTNEWCALSPARPMKYLETASYTFSFDPER